MQLFLGLALVLLAALLQGTFVLPMTMVKSWSWEHLGDLLVAGHVSLELDRYPSPGPKYLRSVCDFAAHDLAVLALFGMGWGLGAVLFGLGMDRLGMALGYPIIMGFIAGLGALIHS